MAGALQKTSEAAMPSSAKAAEAMHKHLEKFNPALAKLAKEAEKIINQSSRLLLEHSFQLGEMFVKADDDKAKYGDNAFEQMCAAVSWSPQNAWRTMQMVRCFPEKQRQSFLTRRSKSGKFISYSHLREIMLLPQENVRNELIEKFYVRGMSSAEARQESHRRRQARGRSPSPTSLAGGFVQINTMARTLYDRLGADLETRLLQKLTQLEAPDQRTKQAAIASVHQLEELGGAVQARAAQMRQLLLVKGWAASVPIVDEPATPVEPPSAPVSAPEPKAAPAVTKPPSVAAAPPLTSPMPPTARSPRRSAAASTPAAAGARTSRPR